MEAQRTRLRLRVVPGAGRTGVVGRHGEAWKVRVAAPPERGRANDAVVDLLSTTLGLSRASVSLVSGQSGRDKIVELAGITEADVDAMLTSAGRKDVRA